MFNAKQALDEFTSFLVYEIRKNDYEKAEKFINSIDNMNVSTINL
jgi:hypothetical protein